MTIEKAKNLFTVGVTVYRGERPIQSGEVYRSDVGDFGRGIYYDMNRSRAKQYGPVTQTVIRFNRPLVISYDDAYKLSDEYQTVRVDPPVKMVEEAIKTGKSFDWPSMSKGILLANAQRMTLAMIEKGYDGLVAVNDRHVEVVDYRPYQHLLEQVCESAKSET